jgi:hypothetical protein
MEVMRKVKAKFPREDEIKAALSGSVEIRYSGMKNVYKTESRGGAK